MKVLLIDDHPLFGMGLQAALSIFEPTVEVLTADSLISAIQFLSDNNDVQVILLDVLLRGENGIVALPELCRQYPSVPVIVLTGVEDIDTIRIAIRNGARGYLSKSQSAEQILDGIRKALNGGKPIAVDGWNQTETVGSSSPAPIRPRLASVLEKLAYGKPNKEIATELGLAETTVRDYVSEILELLNAKNRTEAVAIARDNGWL